MMHDGLLLVTRMMACYWLYSSVVQVCFVVTTSTRVYSTGSLEGKGEKNRKAKNKIRKRGKLPTFGRHKKRNFVGSCAT